MRLLFPAAIEPAVAGVLAVLGLAYFFAASVVLQFLRNDYDWIATPISFYLLGPYSGWLIAAYFALAAALLLVGWGLYRDLAADARSAAPLLLFAVGAGALCVVALAHTDTAEGPHPTFHGVLHNLAAALAFLSTTVAMVLQSWRFRHDPRWRRHHLRALALSGAAFVALWVYALWSALPRGASQKAVILLIVLWLLFASRWLILSRLQPEE
jgi:hypothetical protein